MDEQAIDETVSEFLKETFDLIPILFAEDPRIVLHLQGQIPNMQGYTKKMWTALGARSAIDYISLTTSLGNAFLAVMPKTVLRCESHAIQMEALVAWEQEALGVSFTREELEGRNALSLLSQEIGKAVNKKLAESRNSRT